MEQMPQRMRALVAPKHCRPDGYEIAQLPLPELTEPDQVLIQMRAAAMQVGDCQFASGSARMFLSTRSVPTRLQIRTFTHDVQSTNVRAAPLMPPARLADFP